MSFQASSRAFGDDRQVYLVDAPGDTTRQRLFGTILERNRRFKFVSLVNQF